ncbi:ubiquitin-like protein 7 [Amyelois transitella]|uniref:ubiquitin-like protein 7 n=1 Tax=Amyelois transitella TaxID=680683 RepID=UPI00067B5837|nr:ubiquitin-like protein 7 [Amyelois transitella]
MESQTCIFLGIKVKPGPIIRHKIENFPLDNTVVSLKSEAEKETSVPSASLELIHHGKILKDNATLQDSGVKNGETIHVVKKKEPTTQPPPPTHTDVELQQLNTTLRTLGCTPNAPGWTRAMQLLNDESAMAEIVEQAPSLGEDCVMLSILHEVELLAALGANVTTMRRGAETHPELPRALRHLTRLVYARTNATASNDNALTSGFAYSLEALSEDEDADEEDNEEGERTPITYEQLTAAVQAAEAASSSRGRQDSLLRLLQAADRSAPDAAQPAASGGARAVITPEMFREAITEAIASNRPRPASDTPMEQSNAPSSSQSPPAGPEDYSAALQRMHEMGLRDDALNVRALIICEGDVNAAINLVFSGAIGDD